MKITRSNALSGIPNGLRDPLLEEFDNIVVNYMEHRWSAAELSGGRFSEIVYTILDGHAKGIYAMKPNKPANFVQACRQLENNANAPRSFQILIPRILPALYEVKNNRNVGHVGGDVSPDFMDSSVVVSMSSWIVAELVRVFHALSTRDAQTVVDELAERRLPLVWRSGDMRRVLKPELPLKSQVLVLLASASGKATADELIKWSDYKNDAYFKRLLRKLHASRLVELDESSNTVELLPPGADEASKTVKRHT